MKHELEITGAENPLNCQVQFQSPKSRVGIILHYISPAGHHPTHPSELLRLYVFYQGLISGPVSPKPKLILTQPPSLTLSTPTLVNIVACCYLQSSEPGWAILPGPGGVAGAGREPGCPPATPPVFLLSSELKKLARTPSLVVAAPGFTAVGSICNNRG